jgi:hypothetical protein
MQRSRNFWRLFALIIGCVAVGLLIRIRSQDFRSPQVPQSIVQIDAVDPGLAMGSGRNPAILDPTRRPTPASQTRVLGASDDRNERASVHIAVFGLLNSPAKETPECLEIWNVLRRNGVPIGSLARAALAPQKMRSTLSPLSSFGCVL